MIVEEAVGMMRSTLEAIHALLLDQSDSDRTGAVLAVTELGISWCNERQREIEDEMRNRVAQVEG